MITYCSKCDINWAALWSDSEEHAVDVCPNCKSDQHLQPATDFIAYIKCPFTGKITNYITGEDINAKKEVKKPHYRVTVGKPTYQEVAEEREAREEAAIDAYINSGCNKSIYHSTIKKQN